ncbi:unnamed protein product [Owenia fusiformis]|uniref:Discoidin domain-containing receptor 2 n=1 Tax=Owenia fusiformis TaxID=6347 RepID=A0A8S4P0U9_OWEFU|nr:unnamed protein product [Owenia fusiformis]
MTFIATSKTFSIDLETVKFTERKNRSYWKTRRKLVVTPMMGALLLAILMIQGSMALELGDKCKKDLGMKRNGIPDSAITASSSYDEKSVGPRYSRIRSEEKGGAWCPLATIGKDVYEWLQIDLGNLTVITMVETQGRFGNGQGQEFAEYYVLEYQRTDNGPFKRFRNRQSQEVFNGNTNTYIAEMNDVKPPIIARRIRIVPYSLHQRTICMRVELYGCAWTDGVVSYDMPQGQRRGSEVDLLDFTYDGLIKDNYLSGGLGQLTDGDEGESNFRLDRHSLGRKGYGWIGWRNDSTTMKPITIKFTFDTVRNFTEIRLHCNNMFSKDVRVFRTAMIYFSVGGEYFQPEPAKFTFMKDELMEYARTVIIPIKHRIGKFIQLELTFEARWMMISEIQFKSTPAVGNNITTEVAPPTTIATTTLSTPAPTVPVGDSYETGNNPGVSKPGGPAGGKNEGSSRNNKTNGGSPGDFGGKDDKGVGQKPSKPLDDQYIGIIIGALCALIFILIGIIIFCCRMRRKKQKLSKAPDQVTLESLRDMHPMPLINGKLSNGNTYKCIATSDDIDSDKDTDKCNNDLMYNETNATNNGIQARKLPEVPTPDSSDTLTSREYAVPDVTKSALVVSLPPQQPILPVNPPPSYNPGFMEPPPYPNAPPYHTHEPGHFQDHEFYASEDVINIPNIQGVTGNSIYAAPNPDLLSRLSEGELNIVEFPHDNMKFREKLGEGQFGEVHLCEAYGMGELLTGEELIPGRPARSFLVAVKILRPDATDQARIDFNKEIRIMSKLKDPNVVPVLGVCTKQEPLCMIVEYMKYGDLHQYLVNHVPDNTLTRHTGANIMSYGSLIYMATQIASGMKYLESLNMVHRDLATRNCLVGSHYTIKISDFGMSRSLYSSDYYRIEGRAVLPIRWMAWESILLGKFTSKSDVWSFGVTLWEVLTMAKEHPYEGLTDEQVIENCGHFYRNDGKENYLPKPDMCPKEIYDLMCECWNRTEAGRPPFREIHMFLQRKNMGFDPKDEKMSLCKVPVC